LRLTIVDYYDLKDFFIELGSSYTIIAGLLYVFTTNYIYKDWKDSIRESVKNKQEHYDDKYLMEQLEERVSFKGIFKM
jgi:hypothetical protein